MALFSNYPRFCAVCGKLHMSNPNAPYKEQVCDKACWNVLEMRRTRAIMGHEFNAKADRALCVKEGVNPLPETDLA